jgi:hypothetical protein
LGNFEGNEKEEVRVMSGKRKRLWFYSFEFAREGVGKEKLGLFICLFTSCDDHDEKMLSIQLTHDAVFMEKSSRRGMISIHGGVALSLCLQRGANADYRAPVVLLGVSVLFGVSAIIAD